MMTKRLLWSLIFLLLCAMPTMAQDAEAGYQEALRLIEEARVTGATELDLSNMWLSTLPPEIGLLTHLQVLYAFNNNLTHLPPEIGQLTRLQVLILFDNQLSHLPPEIGQLTRLQALSLYNNQLSALPPRSVSFVASISSVWMATS
jgi:Leucine-rich repeat (LRR) protein